MTVIVSPGTAPQGARKSHTQQHAVFAVQRLLLGQIGPASQLDVHAHAALAVRLYRQTDKRGGTLAVGGDTRELDGSAGRPDVRSTLYRGADFTPSAEARRTARSVSRRGGRIPVGRGSDLQVTETSLNDGVAKAFEGVTDEAGREQQPDSAHAHNQQGKQGSSAVAREVSERDEHQHQGALRRTSSTTRPSARCTTRGARAMMAGS